MTIQTTSIRQKAITYLVEIFVIIIGILGAFLLNNWGADQKKKTIEKEVLEQIYFDLQINLEDLENDLKIHKIGLTSLQRVLSFLDHQITYDQELIFDFYWLKEDEYIFPNTSGYDNLKSLGIDLVQNDSIRQLLTQVYNYDFPRLQRNNTLHPDINEYLTPYFQKNFKTNRDSTLTYNLVINDSLQVKYPRKIGFTGEVYDQYIGFVPRNVELLQQDEQFRFLISETQKFRFYKCYFYSKCIADVKTLIRLIQQELKIER